MTPLAPPFGHPRAGRKGFVPRQPILGTISDLTATAGDGEVVLEWSPPVGATFYQIEYKLSTDSEWSEWFIEPIEYYVTPPAVSGLTNDLAYDFRVIADDTLTTTTSNEVSETPTLASASLVVDDTVASDETQSDSLEFTFTQCDDGTGNPASYYCRIRTPTLSESTWGEAAASEIAIDTNLAIGVTKTVTFPGLAAGTTYECIVLPFRGTTGSAEEFGSFDDTVAASGTTAGAASLGTISDLAATPADSQVSLTWSPAANATSHQPEYKLSSSGTWLQFGSALGAGASSVTVTGLTNDSSYDFRIEAGDGVTTTNSNEVSATPTAATDNEPTDFSVLRTWKGTTLTPSGWSEVSGSVPHAMENDGTQPSGNANFYRHTYPSGLSAGKGTDFNHTGFPNARFNKKFLYWRYWLRFDPNWVHQGTNQGGTQKLCYFGGVMQNGNQEGVNFFAKAIGSNLELAVSLQGGGSGALTRSGTHVWRASGADNIADNGTPNFTRGTWHKVEFWGRSNTGTGNADGALKVWLDGTLYLHFDGNEPEAANNPDIWNYEFQETSVWTSWRTDQIWGGTGGPDLASSQTLDTDDIRISGKD